MSHKNDSGKQKLGAQASAASERGELRNGRLSTIKNHNPIEGAPENEYLDRIADNRGER